MLFSRACDHGLSAMIYVAGNTENGQLVRVREIAEALDIPFPTLAKVIQKLTREGLLTSQKGPGGGIKLARPAGDLTLLEVVEAVENRHLGSECILGITGCSERTLHCPLHDQWKRIREGLVKMLDNRSIEKVAEEMTETSFAFENAIRSKPGPPRAKRTPTKSKRQGAARK